MEDVVQHDFEKIILLSFYLSLLLLILIVQIFQYPDRFNCLKHRD